MSFALSAGPLGQHNPQRPAFAFLSSCEGCAEYVLPSAYTEKHYDPPLTGKRRAENTPWEEEVDPARFSSYKVKERCGWCPRADCPPSRPQRWLPARGASTRSWVSSRAGTPPPVPQQPSAIPFREIVCQGLWKCRSLLNYSAFSGQRRDNFPPFRGNFAHDIHLENSVNLHFIC